MEEVKTVVATEEELPYFSQETLIINHLEKYGSITQNQASALYGITRLAAVVCILRKRGVKIVSVWRNGINRYGRKTRWVEYFI